MVVKCPEWRIDNRFVAGASIGKLADAIANSRTTTVTALRRLRDADLAESLNGAWSLVEAPN
jgi:hypothetical protein